MFELDEEVNTTRSTATNNSTELLDDQDIDLNLPSTQQPMHTLAYSAPTQSRPLIDAAKKANGSAHAIPLTISPTQKISHNEESEESVFGTSSITFAFSPPNRKMDARKGAQEQLKKQLSKSADNSAVTRQNKI